MTRSEIKQVKHEYILHKIGSHRFQNYGPLELVVIYGTMLASAVFNWRAIQFFLSIGDKFPEWVVNMAAAAIALMVASTLKDDCFETVKGWYWLHGGRNTATFRQSLAIFFKTRSAALYLMMLLGLFGAALFLFAATENTEKTVLQAGSAAEQIEQQIAALDAQHQDSRRPLVNSIQIYEQYRRITEKVIPTQAKLARLDSIYWINRNQLNTRLDHVEAEIAAFHPTALLSAIIQNRFPVRLAVCLAVGLLLSLGAVDLVQYRRIWCGFSKLYDDLWCNTDDADIYEIYKRAEETGESNKEMQQNATAPATELQQEKEMLENIEQERAEGGLTALQKKILEVMDKQRRNGGINMSEVARICGVERSTVYRNLEKLRAMFQEDIIENVN